MTPAPNSNKASAISFLTLVTDGKIREAYDKYVDPGARHHNPYHRGDVESLRAGMEGADAQFPGKVFRVQRALEDGEFVAVHSHLTLKPGELELAVVHILRFRAGRIVEFWDIAQAVPKDSPNQYGMF